MNAKACRRDARPETSVQAACRSNSSAMSLHRWRDCWRNFWRRILQSWLIESAELGLRRSPRRPPAMMADRTLKAVTIGLGSQRKNDAARVLLDLPDTEQLGGDWREV